MANHGVLKIVMVLLYGLFDSVSIMGLAFSIATTPNRPRQAKPCGLVPFKESSPLSMWISTKVLSQTEQC